MGVHCPELPCARCESAYREISSYCRPCHNLNGRESLARNGGARRYHLRKRYGIEPEAVDALIAGQGGVCALCRVSVPTHLDHCHSTGQVRGVLCVPCNNGLGLFKDDPAALRRAALYLERETL